MKRSQILYLLTNVASPRFIVRRGGSWVRGLLFGTFLGLLSDPICLFTHGERVSLRCSIRRITTVNDISSAILWIERLFEKSLNRGRIRDAIENKARGI